MLARTVRKLESVWRRTDPSRSRPAPKARRTRKPKTEASIEAARARELALDLKWQLKREQTRLDVLKAAKLQRESRERERLARRDAVRRNEMGLAARLADDVAKAALERSRIEARRADRELLGLTGPQARSKPLPRSDNGSRCLHGLEKLNCAVCTRGRYLPPIRTRRRGGSR